jgi:hypothetical protein
MNRPRRCPSHWLLLLVVAALAGCAGDAVSGLPSELAVRSDVPYVTGIVVARGLDGANPRIRVRDEPGSTARVKEALVSVGPGVTLLWRDGRHASAANLLPGRRVIVWARGPELQSLPPQVLADAILLERD